MVLSTRRYLAIATVFAALGAAACGGETSTGGDVAGVPSVSGAQGAPVPGGGLTVSEAIESELDEPLTVKGFLIDGDGEVRLCETVLESYPPQCGEPSLAVRGVDVASFEGAQSEGGTTWVDEVSLTGDVEDGVLQVSPTVS